MKKMIDRLKELELPLDMYVGVGFCVGFVAFAIAAFASL